MTDPAFDDPKELPKLLIDLANTIATAEPEQAMWEIRDGNGMLVGKARFT